MNAEILNACDHIVAAALNGIYQGILIVLLLSLGLRLMKRTNAATHHAIWFTTLVLLVFLIPAHCFLDSNASVRRPVSTAPTPPNLSHSETFAPAAAAPPQLAVMPDNHDSRPASVISYGSELGRLDPLEIFTRLPSPVRAETGAESAPTSATQQANAEREPSDPARPAATSPARTLKSHPTFAPSQTLLEPQSRWRARRLLQPISWTFTPCSMLPPMASLVLLAAWLGVAMVKASLLFWRLTQLQKLNADAVPAEGALQDLFQRLCCNLGITRKVELKVSPMHRAPVLLGFFHPVVLLPAEHPADSSQTEAILRHELAHLRRHDDWANLAQHLIQALLFFHPAIWWISRQLSIQREIACDDYVLQQGGHARAYALLLADLASRIKSPHPTLAPGVTTTKSQLQERIDMLLNTHRNSSPRLARTRLGFITSAAAILAALTLYAAPRLVLAQASTSPPKAHTSLSVNASQVLPTVPALKESNDLPSSTPLDIEPGPKVKSQNSAVQATEPAGTALPASAASPASPVSSASVNVRQTAVVPRTVSSSHSPRSPVQPYAESSLEQRLSRLEKLVDSLLEQKESTPASSGVSRNERLPKDAKINNDLLKQHQALADLEAARIRDQAKEAEKRLTLQHKHDADATRQQDTARRLDALLKQRELLDREMERLQQQIERLQQDQEKLRQEHQDRSELLEGQANEDQLAALLQEPTVEETPDVPAIPEQE